MALYLYNHHSFLSSKFICTYKTSSFRHDLLVISALMCYQSISSPEIYHLVVKQCPYDKNAYEMPMHFWTWKISRTDCKEQRFLLNDLPQCDFLNLSVVPLSHTVCIYIIIFRWHFYLKFLPSLSLFCCQGPANLQNGDSCVPLFQHFCHSQWLPFG